MIKFAIPATTALNIKEVKPHFILSVPALAKTFKKNIENGIKAKGPKVVKMFEQAVKISQLYHGEGNAVPLSVTEFIFYSLTQDGLAFAQPLAQVVLDKATGGVIKIEN